MKNIINGLKNHILKDLACILVSNIPKSVIKNSDDFKCVLITCFNLGKNPLGIDEEYLNKRLEIFDKYTFSSINAQTDKDFMWVILLNGKTPQKFKDKMTKYENSASISIKLVYADNYDNMISKRQNISNILNGEFKNYKSKWLLTCRCDNDDMLAKNYIEKMKENFRPVHNMFIDFTRGYCLNSFENKLNLYKSRSNHFIGYVEKIYPNTPIKTVYMCNHSFAKDYGYIRRIDNKTYPLWCEVIHETNQINQFQGSCADKKYLKYFQEYFENKMLDTV
ncbi:hypothetical protein IJ182_03785 [bacterium]|nr:hypothetical protein [bacterium]